MKDRIVDLYSKVLERLLNERKVKPDFTFATRVRNNGERLNQGYWFQGNENYIFVPLFSVGDDNNMTKTIGFVVTENAQYIEIVYGNINKKVDKELDFYKELTEYLTSVENLSRQDKGTNRHYFLFNNNDNLETNLDFYINEFRDIALRLLKKYHLMNKYLIDEETFKKNMNKINDYKKYKSGEFASKIATPESKKQLQNATGIKNIILYGSPGVGKTHNTNKLIRLIEDRKSDIEIFEAIKVNEKSYSVDILDIKERVKFITFHQSFGYEDFIEGFRPNEEGNIKLQDGVFKQICEEAQKNLDDSLKVENDISKEKKFEVLFDLFKDFIQDQIDEKQKFDINNTAYITNIEENAFRYQGDNWGNTQRMKFEDIQLLYANNVSERKDIKIINGISGLAKQHATYFSYFMKQLLDFESIQDIQIDEVEKVERKNYYLVIDEINRGNISKIFGELITLIEEDKRNTLEVILPYSKKPFKIPSNLYIIGTMNSTDKSIALIDIALRRRFTFLKMKPKADLIEFSPARKIFENLNKQIEEDLGEDYQLGHSYFMKIENNDDLEFVLEYKIIPLLEEYYYGDDRLIEVISICQN